MWVLYNLFLIGSFLSFVAFIVGIINPSKVWKGKQSNSRLKIIGIYIPLTILFFILFGVTADYANQNRAALQINFPKDSPSTSSSNASLSPPTQPTSIQNGSKTIGVPISIDNIDTSSRAIQTFDYMALEKAYSYTRNDSENTWSYLIERSGLTNIKGKMLYDECSTAMIDNKKSCYFYTLGNKNNIYQVGSSKNGEVTWEKDPRLELFGKMQVGTTYEDKQSDLTGQKITLKGTTNMDVSRKHFTDCIVVEKEDYILDTNGKYTPDLFTRTYYCKGVGLVFFEMNLSGFKDLSYNNPGTGFEYFLSENSHPQMNVNSEDEALQIALMVPKIADMEKNNKKFAFMTDGPTKEGGFTFYSFSFGENSPEKFTTLYHIKVRNDGKVQDGISLGAWVSPNTLK